MVKQLINEKDGAVTESIAGLCAAHSHLCYLDGFPHVKVVIDSSFDKDKHVAVVSGGGAGHEPAFAGFVGAGMLAAAVVGDVFASPPTEAILAAIQSVTGAAGCLLAFMNYTGDRLNFGLAAEQAKGLGLKVDLVIMADDCALPGTGLVGRRGLAGSILIAKVAGAAAAAGGSLEEVRQEAESACQAVGTMGITTSVCTVPGGQESDRLGGDEIEMGLGIHGEPGASKQKIKPAKSIVQEVVDTIVEYSEMRGTKDEIAVMVNNLGTVSPLEMGIVTDSTLRSLSEKDFSISRVYSGTFMTSLDMTGFSISLLRLTKSRTQFLDAPSKAPAWPASNAEFCQQKPLPVPEGVGKQQFSRPQTLSGFGEAAERCIENATDRIIAAAQQLDDWDKRVGDGDCGSTVKRGAAAAKKALQQATPLNDAAMLARSLAGFAQTMGGTSGALYNILFTAAAAELPQEGGADLGQIASGMQSGVAAIKNYGRAEPGHRTMLDALQPASEALSGAARQGASGVEAAQAAAEAAEKGAEATKNMQAGAGRSSYVPESEIEGVPDPGAKAVAVWLRAIAEGLAL